MKCIHCGRSITKLINGLSVGPVCAKEHGISQTQLTAERDELTVDWIEELKENENDKQ